MVILIVRGERMRGQRRRVLREDVSLAVVLLVTLNGYEYFSAFNRDGIM